MGTRGTHLRGGVPTGLSQVEKAMVDLGKSHFDEGLDSGSPFKAGSMAEGVPAPRTLGWVRPCTCNMR